MLIQTSATASCGKLAITNGYVVFPCTSGRFRQITRKCPCAKFGRRNMRCSAVRSILKFSVFPRRNSAFRAKVASKCPRGVRKCRSAICATLFFGLKNKWAALRILLAIFSAEMAASSVAAGKWKRISLRVSCSKGTCFSLYSRISF